MKINSFNESDTRSSQLSSGSFSWGLSVILARTLPGDLVRIYAYITRTLSDGCIDTNLLPGTMVKTGENW
jgi:hypothetical protein